VSASDTPDMQFGAEFFWYQFLVTNRTCCIFMLIYGTRFLVRVFGADYWYVCHGHYTGTYNQPHHSLTHSLLRLTSEGRSDLHNERSCADDHSESIVHP